MVKKIVLFLLVVFTVGCKTDSFKLPDVVALDYTDTLSVEQALADIDYLLKVIEEAHPAAESGLPYEVMKQASKIKEMITEPVVIYDFYFMLSSIIAKLGDGHSFINPRYKEDMLNLPCKWTYNGLVATEDTDYGLKKGDMIRSIGPRSVESILGILENYIPHENKFWVRERSRDYFYRKSFLLGNNIVNLEKETVEIGIERRSGIYTLFANFVSEEDFVKNEVKPFCGYSVYKDKLGVFYLDSCNYNDIYKDTLREFFELVKKKKLDRIVIDLRENTGGSSMVINEFMTYLPLDKVKMFGGYRRFSSHTYKRGYTLRSSGFASYPAEWLPVTQKSSVFKGKVFCLISNKTFSSANWFAEVLQANKAGMLVGQPTGNAPDSFGNIMNFICPNSGLGFTVSWCRWESPFLTEKGGGFRDSVYPDLTVKYMASDYLTGKDPLLEKALLYN